MTVNNGPGRELEDNELVEPTKQGAETTHKTEEFVADVDDRLAVIGDALDSVWRDA